MYEALLVVSFGGPEKPEDVLPFLENVTRGRNIPRDRLLGVAEHYYHFGGRSPINSQNEALIAALRNELEAHGIQLPIYWGNRNWSPYIPEALEEMRRDGIRSALAFFTSAYSSYSGCRQYRENIAAAQAQIGPGAPEIHKVRAFYDHPGFIEACVDGIRQTRTLSQPRLVFTAHSIPQSMAEESDYVRQLQQTARLVAEATGFPDFDLVYQSRSGPPSQPWLEPDILDHLRALHARGIDDVIVSPIGFISDHMEVLYDLDYEAKEVAASLGMRFARAATAGTHPAFIGGIRQMIEQRLASNSVEDACRANCCPPPQRAGRHPVSAGPSVSPQP